MWITLPPQRYPSVAARAAFFDRFGERLQANSSITSWAWTSALPFGGGPTRPVTSDGISVEAGSRSPTAAIVAIGPRYLASLGLRLDQGRDFNDDDGEPGRFYAIVNRRFVRQHFSDVDPIGRHISVPLDDGPKVAATDFTIVGVSPDVRQRSLLEPEPVVYLPARLALPRTAAVVIRSTFPSEAVTAQLREEARALDPELPIYRVMTMERAIWEARYAARVSNRLATTITATALVLALVGLYAVTAHSVALRTREFGIRSALGASSNRTMRLVLRQALVRIAAGILVGFVCTWTWERLLGDGTAPNRATDPSTFVPVALTLIAVAMLACLVPARRATHIDPVIALRVD
jgi:putative ABC transport system permease protein